MANRDERGQMLLGGLLFLLLAAVVGVGLLAAANRSREHLEDLARARDAAFRHSARTAALLNELSINQALVLWHASGALHARRESREALMLSASTRFYGRTPESATTLDKPEGLASFRNALSNPSGRHLSGVAALLLSNAAIAAELTAREPEFLRFVERQDVASAFCRVARDWSAKPALSFPVVGLLTRAFAGRTTLAFEDVGCADIYPLLPEPATSPAMRVGGPASGWEEFSRRAFFPRQAAVLFVWRGNRQRNEAFPRPSKSESGRFRVTVGIAHPRLGEAGALFAPHWAPVLVSSEALGGKESP